eukprot:3818658-Prymnesium_polylepis.1
MGITAVPRAAALSLESCKTRVRLLRTSPTPSEEPNIHTPGSGCASQVFAPSIDRALLGIGSQGLTNL